MSPLSSFEKISRWEFVIALLCVAVNAFFVAAEFAMVKVRTTRLETLGSEGSVLARWAAKIVRDLNPYLSATQFGITLASLGLGWVGEPAFAKIVSPVVSIFTSNPQTLYGASLTLAFISITFLHLV